MSLKATTKRVPVAEEDEALEALVSDRMHRGGKCIPHVVFWREVRRRRKSKSK